MRVGSFVRCLTAMPTRAAGPAQALSLGQPTEYVVMNWKPESGTRLTIVPLDGDKSRIRTFEMPAWFTFHYVNAFGAPLDLPFLPALAPRRQSCFELNAALYVPVLFR